MSRKITLLMASVWSATAMFFVEVPLVSVMANTSHAAAVDLPQTGQNTCYNASGTVIDRLGTGQDGEIRAGVEWPLSRFTDIISAIGFAGGDGSVGAPYQIETAEQLDAVRDYLNANFILIADIDLDIAPYNEGEGWEPIGTYVDWAVNDPFTGNFDGNGHIISGLFIDRPGSSVLGLFAIGAGAEFHDLSLDVNITDGNGYIGGLVGSLEPGVISNVHVSGTIAVSSSDIGGLAGRIREVQISATSSAVTVSGWGNVGGLVGNVQNNSSIAGCRATGSVTSTYGYAVGGLAGTLWSSNLEDSFATGNVIGRESVGGLAGWNGMSAITASYATGDVTATADGNRNFGGLAGNSDSGATIADSYATGDVHGVDLVGGLVGRQTADSSVSGSYATGSVNGETSDIGGLIGINYGGAVTASYYNSETSGQSDTDRGEPRITAQMRAGMSYVAGETYDGWFEAGSPWSIGETFNGGYPYLTVLPRFTVSASISGNGTVGWVGEYPHGARAELLLTPARNWYIGSATGCGGLLDGDLYATAPLTGNCTVHVEFLKKFPWILYMPSLLSSSH